MSLPSGRHGFPRNCSRNRANTEPPIAACSKLPPDIAWTTPLRYSCRSTADSSAARYSSGVTRTSRRASTLMPQPTGRAVTAQFVAVAQALGIVLALFSRRCPPSRSPKSSSWTRPAGKWSSTRARSWRCCAWFPQNTSRHSCVARCERARPNTAAASKLMARRASRTFAPAACRAARDASARTRWPWASAGCAPASVRQWNPLPCWPSRPPGRACPPRRPCRFSPTPGLPRASTSCYRRIFPPRGSAGKSPSDWNWRSARNARCWAHSPRGAGLACAARTSPRWSSLRAASAPFPTGCSCSDGRTFSPSSARCRATRA